MKSHYKNSIRLLLVFISSIFMSVALAANFENLGTKIDDSVITAKVKMLLVRDELISPLSVNVKTQDGIVYLDGNVDTDIQFERVVLLVESVKGVKATETQQLKIKNSKQPIKDILITAKIKGKILRDKLFNDKEVQYWTIKIETRNANVFLSGKVNNTKQKQNIINIARSTKGVKSVKEDIVVQQH